MMETQDKERPSSANVKSYIFDSQASPQEKARSLLHEAPTTLKTEKSNRASELVSDLSSKPAIEMPQPDQTHVGGVEDCSGEEIVAPRSTSNTIIGWEMAGGSNRQEYADFLKEEDNPEQSLALLNKDVHGDHRSADHATALESKLPEGAFGDWYHNTGIIIFSCISNWIVGRFGGGLAWVILLLAICATYYRTSIRRLRRNVRDDISRQLARSKLETDFESAEWMNSFLTKFWIIYEPILSATIVASVDQVLATTTPEFLDSMRLAFFTLGTKAPRIEHVRTYPKSEDDIVLMDWRFSFTPNDVEDLTTRQLKNKINPKIELAIKAGVSVASVNIPIVVEDIAFSGLMQVRIKLMTEYPNIKVVDLSFLEKPSINYVLKPIGGSSLGFDIGFVPGLSGWILEIIHASLEPMMYAPNVFTLNIQQMLSSAPIDSAIGVVVITIHEAHGLRNTDIGSGSPDPYVVLGVNQVEKARTTTITSNANPRFNEVKTLLLTTLKDPLTIEVFDYNEVRKDKSLGIATFDLMKLEEDAEHEHVSEMLTSNGKTRGSINFSASWYPVLTAPKLEDGTLGPIPDSNAGIVRFTVHQAKNLGGGKSTNPYGVLTMNSKMVAKTPKMKHTNNPVWDFSQEILVQDKSRCVLGVQIKNDELGGDQVLGTHTMKLVDLLGDTENEVDEFALHHSRDPNARVKVTAVWKPIAGMGGLSGKSYVAPIGALRIRFIRAVDLRNPEAGLIGGKADPYMRVMVNSQIVARTVTIKNEQNPVWNEIFYIPVKTVRAKIVLEVMDYQARTKDRSLGLIEIDPATLIQQDNEGAYLQHHENAVRATNFSGREAKGSLQYEISFFPAMSVMTAEEADQADKEAAEAANPTQSIGHATTPSKSQSEDQANHSRSVSTFTTASSKRATDLPKIRLSIDDLHNHQSGFLVFELLEGQLPQSGCYLQVLFDDHLYPSYTTSRARSHKVTWNETGEGFIRELDVSNIVLRITKEIHSSESDQIIATSIEETYSVLCRAFNQVSTGQLRTKDGELCQISYRCRFIPVKVKLDPRESINNMGTLQVTILNGRHLCAADKGNKSDPYAKFYLDTSKEHVYKTETIKKTLNPDWNETFECPIASRIDNVFRIEVYDWDQIGDDDHLGTAVIPLMDLDPMTSKALEISLNGPKGDNGKSGTIQLRLLFKPNFVTRTRRGTTARASTIANGVVSSPVRVVGAGLLGMKKTGSFIGGRFGGRRSNSSVQASPEIQVIRSGATVVRDPSSTIVPADSPTSAFPAILDSQETRSSQENNGAQGSLQASPYNTKNLDPNSPGTEGLLHVKLISGEGFPSDRKTTVKVRSRSGNTLGKVDVAKGPNPVIDAEIRYMSSSSEELHFALMEQHTFGNDKEIAEAKQLVSSAILSGERIKLQFEGYTAILTLELRFSSADAASIKSRRGFKLNSPFRKSSSQR